jgi:hypothetical protein
MTDEFWGTYHSLIEAQCLHFPRGGLRKTMKLIIQDPRCPGRNSNWALSGYESTAFATGWLFTSETSYDSFLKLRVTDIFNKILGMSYPTQWAQKNIGPSFLCFLTIIGERTLKRFEISTSAMIWIVVFCAHTTKCYIQLAMFRRICCLLLQPERVWEQTVKENTHTQKRRRDREMGSTSVANNHLKYLSDRPRCSNVNK